MQTSFVIQTQGPGLYEFTDAVQDWVGAVNLNQALLTLFIQHTSASLLIQENADPDVQTDLLNWIGRFVPPANDPSMSYLRHTCEGPDDMPAHIKAALLPTILSIPVSDGRMVLGTWQGLYIVEHRTSWHQRHVMAHLS